MVESRKRPLIIAFSGKAGSGKTTAAFQYLVGNPRARICPFATPLKRMPNALSPEGTVGMPITSYKEDIHILLSGHTPRYALQTLGTEWGRVCMGENFWVNLWKYDLDAMLRHPYSGDDTVVIVDDLRFENEAAAVRSLGGHVVEIVRPGHVLPINTDHPSEQGVKPDFVLTNDASIEGFHEDVLALVEKLTKMQGL